MVLAACGGGNSNSGWTDNQREDYIEQEMQNGSTREQATCYPRDSRSPVAAKAAEADFTKGSKDPQIAGFLAVGVRYVRMSL